MDEIGDLPLSTQVKLLRVLEEKVIERVGDHRPIPVDVRIITATNRNLSQLIAEGKFREDFYYRINVIPIQVPPLRDRREDIPMLAESFFNRLRMKNEKQIQSIAKETLDTLMQHAWPGNVRELKSAFEYAFVSSQGPVITPLDLPPQMFSNKPKPASVEIDAQDLNAIKQQRLIDALRASDGNQAKAARMLGISRTSVWKQIKRYGIPMPIQNGL